LDQLTRSQALPADQIANLQKAIHSAEASHLSKGKVKNLQKMAPSVQQSADSAKTPADAARMHALAKILEHPVA